MDNANQDATQGVVAQNVALAHMEKALAAAQVEIAQLRTEKAELQIEVNRLEADVLIRDTLDGNLYKYISLDIKKLLREAMLPYAPVNSEGRLDQEALKTQLAEKAKRFLGDSSQGSSLPPTQKRQVR